MNESILIVDDEPDICDMISLMLKRQGYDVTVAFTGEHCLQILDERPVDILVLDIMMPKMDGWEVLDGIAETGKNPKVIICTVTDPEREMMRKYEGRFHSFFNKSKNITKLVDVVRELTE